MWRFFVGVLMNDSNISRLRSALRTYPDLIRIREDVLMIVIFHDYEVLQGHILIL